MSRSASEPEPTAGARISAALTCGAGDPPFLVGYLVAGLPDPESFPRVLERAAREADVLEIGLPFSDPTADGPVIAEASRSALARGVSLNWLLDLLASLPAKPAAPLVLMTYFNPLFALGLEESVRRMAAVGFEGLIVPDLPLEESGPLRRLCDAQRLALVQLVAPNTPPARIERLCAASRGFVYAVARTGITGEATDIESIRAHLQGVRSVSRLPVAAGFGIRNAAQIEALRGAVDAAVVGTALVQAITRGQDPGLFLGSLRTQCLPQALPPNPAPLDPDSESELAQ